MRHLLILALLAFQPAAADTKTDPLAELFKGLEQLGQDGATVLNDLMHELGPHLERLGSEIGDLSLYEPPEVLENGDIIIRRKKSPPPNAEPLGKQTEEEADGIEL